MWSHGGESGTLTREEIPELMQAVFTVGDPTRESDGLAFCVWWCRGWEFCALLPGDHLPHTRPHCEECQLGQWRQLPGAPRVGGRAPPAPA